MVVEDAVARKIPEKISEEGLQKYFETTTISLHVSEVPTQRERKRVYHAILPQFIVESVLFPYKGITQPLWTVNEAKKPGNTKWLPGFFVFGAKHEDESFDQSCQTGTRRRQKETERSQEKRNPVGLQRRRTLLQRAYESKRETILEKVEKKTR